MRLCLLLHRRFRVPIVMHILDDWIGTMHRKRVLGKVLRPLFERTFRDLVSASARRFAISGLMAEEYLRRYGCEFDVLMNCEDSTTFLSTPGVRVAGADEYSIVCSGTLKKGRWRAIVDLGEAIERMRLEGAKIRLDVFGYGVPPEAAPALAALSSVRLHGAIASSAVPAIFRGADLLFLPESFESEHREYMRCSISAKAHLYMMSARPTLVYGPAGTAVVEYARSEKWGVVVDTPGIESLVVALRELIGNKALCELIVKNGRRVAQANHEGVVIRERFRRGVVEACQEGQSGGVREVARNSRDAKSEQSDPA